MAQIIITVIDTENGAANSTYKIKDKDISRIYKAFKYKLAYDYLQRKKNTEEVLEASDTVENISTQVTGQDVVNEVCNMFISNLIGRAHDIEKNKLIQDFFDKNPYIEVEEEDNE